MNPIYKTKILQGHSRPIKDIKFSNDGKFIFSASSDRLVKKWDFKSNKSLFDFNHQASVNSIALSNDNKLMFTGDSTGCLYIWDINSNLLFKKIEFEAIFNLSSIDVSYDDKFIIIVINYRKKNTQSFIRTYEISKILNENNENNNENNNNFPIFKIFICSNLETKYSKAKFVDFNNLIIVSREDGILEKIDFKTEKIIKSEKIHNDAILDFDINFDNNLILTSGKDCNMNLINLNNFKIIQTFHPSNPNRNLNACKLIIIENPFYKIPNLIPFPITIENMFDVYSHDYNEILFDSKKKNNNNKFGEYKNIILCVVSGGQDSKFVTTTKTNEGGFDIIIYNGRNGEQLASFLDHFGPVNTLAVYEKILASGAEDSTVRIHEIEHYLFDKL
jgi:WD40 repeat protein